MMQIKSHPFTVKAKHNWKIGHAIDWLNSHQVRYVWIGASPPYDDVACIIDDEQHTGDEMWFHFSDRDAALMFKLSVEHVTWR